MVGLSVASVPSKKSNLSRLQERVTDIESNAATPSAILHPSVGVIIIAHSMGYNTPVTLYGMYFH